MTAWADETVQRLLAKGLRNGGARRAVIELLAGQNCCLTAQEIFDELRASGRRVGIASVYRILELLTAEGMVQRIDLGSGTARYEPVWPDGHHHHLVCDSCGKVEAFETRRSRPRSPASRNAPATPSQATTSCCTAPVPTATPESELLESRRVFGGTKASHALMSGCHRACPLRTCRSVPQAAKC